MRPDTLLVHAGEPRPRDGGAVAMPIYQSSTFEETEARGYHDIRYARLSNTPTHEALHAKLAALEEAEAALATASGMAAVSAALLSVLRAGDHVVAQDGLYGGTHDLLTRDLPRLGITVTFVSGDDPAAWRAAATPKTRVFYVEALTNPLLRVADLPAAAAFARERDLVSIIDNTFATPLAFRPLRHRFDLVLHSATKYLNGHSDVIAGAVMGSAARVREVKRTLDHLGGSLDPHACFLLQRGLKTLGVRYRQQCATSLAVAKFLEKQRAVARVNHPGLESHPQHSRARELFAHFGGMLSFELKGGADAAERMFSELKIPLHAPSLGGPETLVTRPAASSHVGLTAEERARIGISDGLVRVSIGLEAAEDLMEDFAQALREG
ncbi:MAG: aminotransferase class I/II-fold pyridoxal phosphate-dependent enzyme [Deltaproteobacteria bacterium]|nr:MAG: aminotransferase class I/II-fold pyridoxal phosphate-dependent enzyme [Deltaproteobacteria bacterium]TMB33729.1 MAG: aminotransferase class I/II-fold pyridoxal phosphate-dependent enzyme [Deltaproteobacteria bacterium]